MRQLLTLTVFFVMLFTGCKKQAPATAVFTLKGTIENPDNSPLVAVIQSDTSCFVLDTLPVEQGTFSLSHASDTLVRVNLLYAGKAHTLYLTGGDSVSVAIKTDTLITSGKHNPFINWSIADYQAHRVDSLQRLPAVIRNQIQTYLNYSEKVQTGKKIPYILFRDIKGNNFSSMESNNNYRLVTCWASWDSTSVKQVKKLAALAKKADGKAFDFISISLDTNDSIWQEQVKEWKIPGRNIRLKEGFASQIAQTLNITTLPYNILMSAQSVVEGINMPYEAVETYLKEEIPAKSASNGIPAKTSRKTTSLSKPKPNLEGKKITSNEI